MNYKFVKISSYYSAYLKYFYKKNRNIPKDYNAHLQLLLDDFFIYGNSFSKYLRELGNETFEIILDEHLQKKWAFQNDMKIKKNWQRFILIEQLKKINPDVIFWNTYTDEEFFKFIKKEIPTLKLNFTQIGLRTHNYKYFQKFNFIISCLKSYVDEINLKGIDSYFIRHGFHSSILDKIKPQKESIDFSFFGSIISGYQNHNKRVEYLKYLLEEISLNIWTDFKNPSYSEYFKEDIKRFIKFNINIFERSGINLSILLSKSMFNKINNCKKHHATKLIKIENSIYERFKEAVYGIEMFQKIANSKISFNIHADGANQEAANIRMYEVTGIGTCLLTDWKEDISEYFEPDHEIVTYKSKEEVLEKVKFLLDNPKEREKIALSGQKRTLRDHTLKKRVENVNEIILKYL